MKQAAFTRTEYHNLSLVILITVVVTVIAPATTDGYAFLTANAQTVEPQGTAQESKQADVREITSSTPIERELSGGESHSYRVMLTAGQYLLVVVEQKGIDVVVKLFGPDGQKILEVDSPNGMQGPEPVSLVADASGEYRIEVKALDRKAVRGRYAVRVEELRVAMTRDRDRITAERAFADAQPLLNQGTAESLRTAIEKYNEALSHWRRMGNRQGEALALNQIGQSYWYLGENQKALEYYNQALPLKRALGDRAGEATSLGGIGLANNRLGNLREALDYYNQALALKRAAGDRQGVATTLNNIGTTDYALGNVEQAFESLNQSLTIARAIGDSRGEGRALSGIGVIYWDLGENQKALETYNQDLVLRRATGDRSGESATLYSIGVVYLSLGDLQKALEYHNQALTLARGMGDRRTEAFTLTQIASVYRSSGELQKALEYYNQALMLQRGMGDRLREANTLSNIGASYSLLGKPNEALQYLKQALSLHRTIGDRQGEPGTLRSISLAERDRGRLTEARAQIEEALKIIESTRSKFVSQEARTSFSASRQSYYEFYVDLLMRMHKAQPSAGHDADALQASERARARSLLEILTESRADIRQGVDPRLLARERSLQQQLNAKSERLTRLLSGKLSEEQETTARKEVEAVLMDYQDVEAQIRAKSPRYAALTQPQPLSVKDLQQLLDNETVLLEYALGEDRSYLWAVTPTSIKSYELPKRAEIETAARRAYDLLVIKADTLNPEAFTSLSQTLLGPVADQLGRKRLLIVGQGALQYVPFGALPNPARQSARIKGRGGIGKPLSSQSLVVRHEIVTLPSASVLAVLRRDRSRRPAAPDRVAVLADPVFGTDDQRVKSQIPNQPAIARDGTERGSGRSSLSNDMQRSASDLNLSSFDRLPVSRSEAAFITAMVPEGQSLQALDFSASRATATSPALARYQIVHFATHSLLNNQHPELSGIVLSLVDEQGQPQDGFLRLHDIYNLNLQADLVVLSACQTALGKEIKGEGLVGLTRGFMYAGAPRVVASLWKVSDAATAELMKRFYQKMLKGGLRPAAALREAQVSMLREKQWAAPYYWAGFVLQGEWR